MARRRSDEWRDAGSGSRVSVCRCSVSLFHVKRARAVRDEQSDRSRSAHEGDPRGRDGLVLVAPMRRDRPMFHVKPCLARRAQLDWPSCPVRTAWALGDRCRFAVVTFRPGSSGRRRRRRSVRPRERGWRPWPRWSTGRAAGSVGGEPGVIAGLSGGPYRRAVAWSVPGVTSTLPRRVADRRRRGCRLPAPAGGRAPSWASLSWASVCLQRSA